MKKAFVVTSAAPSEGNSHANFFATRWSVVLAAGGPDADGRRQMALEEFARIYWFPLYAYVRRQGHSPHAAEDLTQSSLAAREKHRLRHVDQSKGKFRSFLLASIKHFLANEYDKSRAQKRGGPKKILALNAFDAEARYAIEPIDDMTPERIFEQRWAWAVIDEVLSRLRGQYAAKGQSALFEALKEALTQRPDDGAYDEVARALGMTPGAIAVAVHRLRGRYRKLLRDEIAKPLPSQDLLTTKSNIYWIACNFRRHLLL